MSQPGWYPDPQGSGGLRWWDGYQWTGHVQPTQPQAPYPAQAPRQQPYAQNPYPPQPQQYGQQQYGQQRPGEVLDTTHWGKRLYADGQVISLGESTMPLADIEWIAYWSVRAYMRGALNIKMGGGSEWYFHVGRYPLKGGPRIRVEWTKWRTKGMNDDWGMLVALAQRHLQPRLVTNLAARIKGGQSVDLDAGVTLEPGGLRSKPVSLDWPEIIGATLEGGYAFIVKTGNRPALKISQKNANAVLLPDLISAVKR